MSTVILLKDRPPAKAGDAISVPFFVGKKMVADEEAKYPDSPIPPAPASEDAAATLARVREQHANQIEKLTAEYEQKVADLTAERDALKAQLEGGGKKQR
jgi:hypothetical protein